MKSKLEVVKLQDNDPFNIQLWKFMCDISRREFLSVYQLLGIDQRLLERGESYYNSYLPGIVRDLVEKNIASKHDDAVLIYESNLSEYNQTSNTKSKSTKESGSHSALMIQKSDGAYLYGTTDLAAVYHRCMIEKADRVLYVTDIGQASHFKMVFNASTLAGYIPDGTTLQHVGFGLVLGEDGKRLRSRSGDTFPLRELISLAIESAREVVTKRHSEKETSSKWSKEKIDHLAQVLGIGAVKYADLSMNRESGYKFSLQKMLSFDGNTAPYMLYAYVRVKGIYRKAADLNLDLHSETLQTLTTKEELNLSTHLIKFPEIIDEVSKNCCPNRVS